MIRVTWNWTEGRILEAYEAVPGWYLAAFPTCKHPYPFPVGSHPLAILAEFPMDRQPFISDVDGMKCRVCEIRRERERQAKRRAEGRV